jgi:Spy/CpxP family protein refolding chaperone
MGIPGIFLYFYTFLPHSQGILHTKTSTLPVERRIIMKKLGVISAVLALSLAGGSYAVRAEIGGPPARAGDDGKSRHGRVAAGEMQEEKHIAVMARVLRLSEAQKNKMRGLFQAGHGEMESLMKEIAENRLLLRQKTEAAVFNEGEVKALAEKQGMLMARMLITPARMRRNFRALLTPEQRDLEERIFPLLAHGPGLPPEMDGEGGLIRAGRFRPSAEDFPPPPPGEIPPPCFFDH